MYTQPLLIRRDTNFNLVSSDTFGELSPYPHNFSHIQLLDNNDVLTVGTIPQKYPIAPITDEINSLSGWINKFGDSGEIVWTFIDTAFWSSISGSNNMLYDAIELTSGSIVACGYNRTLEPLPKDWGWLIKINSNGCIDTLNCEFVSTISPEIFDVEVFPNPARNFVIFNTMNPSQYLKSIAIYNFNGVLVENFDLNNSSNSSQWNCNSAPRGTYFYRLLSSTGLVGTGKFVLH